MKKQKLFKSLLVAVCLLVGASAWAAAGDVKTNLDIDFSNDIVTSSTSPKYSIAGTVGSMTWDNQWSTNPSIVEGVLRFGNFTGTAALQDNTIGSKDVVTISFDLAFGKLTGKHIGFILNDTDGNAILTQYFDAYNGDFDDQNPLNLDWSKMYRGSNTVIQDRCVYFTITLNYATNEITTKTKCYMSGTSKPATEAVFSAALPSNKPLGSFAITGNINNDGRFSTLDNLKITTTEGDYSAATADYTVNWVCDNNTVKTETRNGDVDASISLIATDKQAFTLDNQKYMYVSDDASGKTVDENGTTVVTIIIRKAGNFAYTINAVDGESNILQTITTGTYTEGESLTIPYPHYVNVNGTLFNRDATNKEYRQVITISEDNQVTNLTYTATDIENVIFYAEAENLNGVGIFNSGNSLIRSSNAASAYSSTDATITSLGVGKYKISTVACVPGSGTVAFVIKADNRTIHSTSGSSNNWIASNSEFVLAKDANITFNGGNAGSGLDFVYIQSLGEASAEELAEAAAADVKADKAARVFNIIGLLNDWNTDHQMTQSTVEGEEDIYTFTTQAEVWGDEDAKYFEYKLRQNSDWNGYQLPAEGNGNKSWSANDGIGVYTLTFTADIEHNTVDCEAVKTSDFTYAVVGCKTVWNDGTQQNEELANELFATAWDTSNPTNIMTKDGSKWTWKKNEVELTVQNIALKVIVKGTLSDRVNWYPANNVNLNIDSDGIYYITVTFDGSDVTATAELKQTYTVAGCYKVGESEAASFLGATWNPAHSENNMTRNNDGIYELEFKDIDLEPGSIVYKVAVGNAWTTAYPAENQTWDVKEAGTYDIIFTFDPISKDVACNLAIKKEISSAGYATYYSSYDIDFASAGLTAYIANLNGNTVTFTPIDDAPLNTGVLLKGDEGAYKLPIITTSTTKVTGNILIGTVSGTTAPAGSFVLLNGSEGVGFYKTNNAFTVGANTAYIEALPNNARFIGFNLDEATAIEGVAAEKANNGEIYNLQGQRVMKAQKGLYIINGKKMLVK